MSAAAGAVAEQPSLVVSGVAKSFGERRAARDLEAHVADRAALAEALGDPGDDERRLLGDRAR